MDSSVHLIYHDPSIVITGSPRAGLERLCEIFEGQSQTFVFCGINATIGTWTEQLCIGQIEASTCPPPGIPRAFDTFAVPGRREFDYQSLLGGREFDPHALGVGNLNCTLDFI